MSGHRLSRMFALGNFAVATAVLLSMAIVLQSPERLFAQTTQNSTCAAPSFYSLKITPASLNTPWSLPLLSTIDGPYAPTVTAKGLPPGIELKDEKSTLAAGGSTLHVWMLSGAPSQFGTYTITVTAQNTCGGASSVITLPINNVPTSQGSVCPAGTTGTYPNCNVAVVAFDTESLVVSTSTPTITGTSNTAKVSLAVKNNAGSVYTSPLFSVLSGRWAIPLSNISTGTYSLFLYNENNVLLIPGTLVAAVPSTAGSMTPALVPKTLTTAAITSISSTGMCAQLPTATMQIGGRGTGVENLQNFLIQKGLLAPGSATGYFGPLTRSAVQKFQASAGIVSSGDEATTGFGLVGARTRALIACQGSMSPNSSAPQPSVQRIVCPAVPQPPCATGGTLISLGFDTNGCSLGKICQQPYGQQGQNRVCPIVKNPSCLYGTLISLGTDYDGCSMGSYCQQPICNYIQQVTSCPAGQTLVSGNDKYGCPNVSYCSGTPVTTPDNPICLAVAYPIPSCPPGQYVQFNTSTSGCPAAPTCVSYGF